MISDSLTKKMGSSYLRAVLKHGKWSLSEKGNAALDFRLKSGLAARFQPIESVGSVNTALRTWLKSL